MRNVVNEYTRNVFMCLLCQCTQRDFASFSGLYRPSKETPASFKSKLEVLPFLYASCRIFRSTKSRRVKNVTDSLGTSTDVWAWVYDAYKNAPLTSSYKNHALGKSQKCYNLYTFELLYSSNFSLIWTLKKGDRRTRGVRVSGMPQPSDTPSNTDRLPFSFTQRFSTKTVGRITKSSIIVRTRHFQIPKACEIPLFAQMCASIQFWSSIVI